MFEKLKILDFFEQVQGLPPYFEGESGDLLKEITSSYSKLYEIIFLISSGDESF